MESVEQLTSRFDELLEATQDQVSVNTIGL
jgi:hypothetical protein